MNYFINTKGLVTGPFDLQSIQQKFLSSNTPGFVLFSHAKSGPWTPLSQFHSKEIEPRLLKEKALKKTHELEKHQAWLNDYPQHQWFYRDKMARQNGPVSFAVLNKRFQAGFLHFQSKVRPTHDTNWISLEIVLGLVPREEENSPSQDHPNLPSTTTIDPTSKIRIPNLVPEPPKKAKAKKPNPSQSNMPLWGFFSGMFLAMVGRSSANSHIISGSNQDGHSGEEDPSVSNSQDSYEDSSYSEADSNDSVEVDNLSETDSDWSGGGDSGGEMDFGGGDSGGGMDFGGGDW